LHILANDGKTADMDKPFCGVEVICQKDIGDAMPLILIIFAHRDTAFHRQGLNRIAKKNTRTLIKSDTWTLGILWAAVQEQNIFHAGNILGIQRRYTPILLLMRLYLVFFNIAPIVAGATPSQIWSSTTLSANRRNVHRARPLGA
jgi:hypothetical protein